MIQLNREAGISKKYYGTLTQYLDCISDEDADCAIKTIQKLYEIMQERRINLE